jgi:hypothetical protein
LTIDIEYQVTCTDSDIWTVYREGQVVSRHADSFEAVDAATQMAEQDARLLRKNTKVFFSPSPSERRLSTCFTVDD